MKILILGRIARKSNILRKRICLTEITTNTIMNSYAKSNPENYLYNKDLLDIEGSQVRMIIDGKKRKVDKKYGIEWKEVDDVIYKLNNDQKDILFGV